MFGPAGTVGAAGTGPRMPGTQVQISVLLSRNQSHGSPVVALSRSVPLIILDFPVVLSAIHSSMPLVFVLRKDKCVPSGEKWMFERFACAGTMTLVSVPSEIFL